MILSAATLVLLLLWAPFRTASAAPSTLPMPMMERYVLTDCRSLEAKNKLSSFVANATLLGDLLPIPQGSSSSSTTTAAMMECDPAWGMRITPPPSDTTTTTGDSSSTTTTTTGDSTFLESSSNLQALQEHYASSQTVVSGSDFTLAFWMTPANASAASNEQQQQQQTILTVDDEIPRDNDWWSCAHLRLSQLQQSLVVTFRDSDDICRRLVVRNRPLPPHVMVHVVVSFNATAVSVYMDGVTIVPGAPRTIPDLASWDPSSTLRLFGGSHDMDASAFAGWIQQLDLYDQFFTAEHAIEHNKQGIYYVKQIDDEVFLPPPEYKNETIDLWEEKEPQQQEENLELILAQDDTQGIVASLFTVFSANVRPLIVAMQVTELPAYGFLLNDDSNVTIVEDANIPPMEATKVNLRYRLYSDDYFNAPTRQGQGAVLSRPSDSFAYRWVALHPQTWEVVHSSEPVTIPIHVIHVNHKPTITAPITTIQMPSNVDNGILPTTPLRIVTGDFVVTDPLDFDLDRVRVDVWCEAGTMTLNPTHRNLADFGSCSRRTLSSWQCLGTGVDDRRMTFLVLPTDAPLVLHNLQYQALQPGTNDLIRIKLYDGMSSPEDYQQLGCMDKSEHEAFSVGHLGNRFTTIHHECWMQEVSIPIKSIDEDNPDDENDGNSSADDVKEYIMLGGVGLAVFCCTCFCGRGHIARFLARGRNTQADTETKQESETTQDGEAPDESPDEPPV